MHVRHSLSDSCPILVRFFSDSKASDKDRTRIGQESDKKRVITYGGFLLSMAAIKYISVSLASVLGATEPIFVLLLAFLLMREKVTKREVIGTIVTLVGLFLIINSERL